MRSSRVYTRLLEALTFAADKHRQQRRKDVEASPYINHPIAVASVLAQAVLTMDETSLLAAILHDTVEDTETTLDELKEIFGAEIAGIVAELTDDKSLPKEVRKQLQVARASTASDSAKRVKIADKICNIRDVATAPPPDWSKERRLAYLDWAEQVVAGCRGVEPALEKVFDQVIAEARRALGADEG